MRVDQHGHLVTGREARRGGRGLRKDMREQHISQIINLLFVARMILAEDEGLPEMAAEIWDCRCSPSFR